MDHAKLNYCTGKFTEDHILVVQNPVDLAMFVDTRSSLRRRLVTPKKYISLEPVA